MNLLNAEFELNPSEPDLILHHPQRTGSGVLFLENLSPYDVDVKYFHAPDGKTWVAKGAKDVTVPKRGGLVTVVIGEEDAWTKLESDISKHTLRAEYAGTFDVRESREPSVKPDWRV